METCGLVNHRPSLCLALIIVFVIGSTFRAQAQEPVPPDHYDPDDTTTYSDVVAVDRSVKFAGGNSLFTFTDSGMRAQSLRQSTPAVMEAGVVLHHVLRSNWRML